MNGNKGDCKSGQCPAYGESQCGSLRRDLPAGIENPELGYLGYAAVKFAGYSLAAALISRKYERYDRSPSLIGGVRTLIGMTAGAVCYGLTLLIPALQPACGIVFLIGIIPVRIAEWWLLLWLFFDLELKQTQKRMAGRCRGFGLVIRS